MSKYVIVILLALVTFGFINYNQNKKIVVAVIDSGYDKEDKETVAKLCKEFPTYDLTNTGMQDTMGHGTNVINLIEANALESNYCFVIIKFFNDKADSRTNQKNFIRALEIVNRIEPNFVNISGGGNGYNIEEEKLLQYSQSSQFIVAAGNEGIDFDDEDSEKYYPANYDFPNILVVGSLNKRGKKSSFSNYGKIVKYWQIGEYDFGQGTSFSAAVMTGKMIHEMDSNSSKSN